MTWLSADLLRERLANGAPVISDGGMGSELIHRGIAPEDTLKANFFAPEVVRGIHHTYILAGANLITCNTFGVRDGEEWLAAVSRGIDLALEAVRMVDREVGVWIAFPGSVIASVPEACLHAVTRARGVPRLLLVETCTTLQEATTATHRALSCGAELLAVTAHFRADCTMLDGATPERFAEDVAAAGADVVGANCGEVPERFIQVTVRMRNVVEMPLLVQPSAGMPQKDASGSWRYPVTPERFADVGHQLFAAGAAIVGGCCGTSPAHITALCAKQAC